MEEFKRRTGRSQIVHTIRMLWLRSVERSEALKRTKYCCEKCGVKRSVAKGKEQKVEVHHKEGIGNWDAVVEVIRKEILCDPDNLEVLCPECHDKQHR
jgi:predicted HNH restriction endonuclease